jgi:hypothetical protein
MRFSKSSISRKKPLSLLVATVTRTFKVASGFQHMVRERLEVARVVKWKTIH